MARRIASTLHDTTRPRSSPKTTTTKTITYPQGMQPRDGAGGVGADGVREREGKLGVAVYHHKQMCLALIDSFINLDVGCCGVEWKAWHGWLCVYTCRYIKHAPGAPPRTRAAPAPPAPRPRAGRRCPPPPVCRRPNTPDRGVKSRVTRTCEQPPQGAPKHPSTHPSTYLVRRRLPRVATGPDGAERLDAHPVQLQEPRHLCVVRV